MNRKSLSDYKIIQLSDCHVAADRDADYRGIKADKALAGLLPAVRAWQPDLILLTGDVSEDASVASYGRVSARLSSIGAPVVALPGNHDRPETMKRFFPQGPWDGPFFCAARGWQLVLLDSTEAGRIDGVVSEEQIQRLELGLRHSRSEHVMIALHHQPIAVGSPWIDRYALQDPEKLLSVLDRESRLRCVTWGHVHQAFAAEREGAAFLGSPSTAANSIPGREKFTLDVGGPAGRWFRLCADGRFETGILTARG